AVGPPLRDAREDLIRLAAVDPLVVHERRADRAAAGETVAARAVERAVQPFALREAPRVVLVRARHQRVALRTARLERRQPDADVTVRGRGKLLVPRFAFASGLRERDGNEQPGGSGERARHDPVPSVAASMRGMPNAFRIESISP